MPRPGGFIKRSRGDREGRGGLERSEERSSKNEDIGDENNRGDENMVSRAEAERLAEIAAERALKRLRQVTEDDEGQLIPIDSKLVKNMENLGVFFNTMKSVFQNPLQQTIEQKVGTLAANVVESAFSPRPTENRDLTDKLLNSAFAANAGAALGQRTPELIDTLTKNYGQQRVGNWLDQGVQALKPRSGIGQPPISSPGVNSHGGSGSPGGSSGSPSHGRNEDVETILRLDENNPEHVAAYAESQGGLSIEVARKMLMVHKDDFLRQLERKGTSGGLGKFGPGIQQVEYQGPMPSNYSRNQVDNTSPIRQVVEPVVEPVVEQYVETQPGTDIDNITVVGNINDDSWTREEGKITELGKTDNIEKGVLPKILPKVDFTDDTNANIPTPDSGILTEIPNMIDTAFEGMRQEISNMFNNEIGVLKNNLNDLQKEIEILKSKGEGAGVETEIKIPDGITQEIEVPDGTTSEIEVPDGTTSEIEVPDGTTSEIEVPTIHETESNIELVNKEDTKYCGEHENIVKEEDLRMIDKHLKLDKRWIEGEFTNVKLDKDNKIVEYYSKKTKTWIKNKLKINI